MKENTLSWEAVYNDGTNYKQFNKDGSENKYTGIDRLRLRRFNVYFGEKIIYAVFLHGNQKLIFRRRSLIHMTPKTNQEQTEIIVVVGYHELIDTLDGQKDRYTINYLNENGFIELDDHRENLQLIQEEM